MKLLEKLKQLTEGRLIRGVQIVLLAWLAMMAVTALVRSFVTHGQAAEAIGAYQALEKQAAESAPKSDDRIVKLTANNLFVPSQGPPKPPQCLAILGDTALIGDQWYKVGEIAAGAKILEIGPNFIKVLWNEKEEQLKPFDVEVSYGPADKGPAPSGPSPGGVPPTAGPGPESRGRSGGPSGGGGGGGGQDMRRRFESISPEQRRQMMERYQNASPEEQQRMREEFRRGRSNQQ